MRVARASVTPASWHDTPLAVSHPPLARLGDARAIVQSTPSRRSKVHRCHWAEFTLFAKFVLDTTAGGICNAHAAADFSPDTTLPAEWVRMRDPFQGVSKRAFGFTLVLSASAPSDRVPNVGETDNARTRAGTRGNRQPPAQNGDTVRHASDSRSL